MCPVKSEWRVRERERERKIGTSESIQDRSHIVDLTLRSLYRRKQQLTQNGMTFRRESENEPEILKTIRSKKV